MKILAILLALFCISLSLVFWFFMALVEVETKRRELLDNEDLEEK